MLEKENYIPFEMVLSHMRHLNAGERCNLSFLKFVAPSKRVMLPLLKRVIHLWKIQLC